MVFVIVQDVLVRISDDNKPLENVVELVVNANDDPTVVENTDEQVKKVTDDNKDDKAPAELLGNDLCLPVILSLCL